MMMRSLLRTRALSAHRAHRANQRIQAIQDACPHPDTTEKVATQATAVCEAGDIVTWCRRCRKVLSVR